MSCRDRFCYHFKLWQNWFGRGKEEEPVVPHDSPIMRIIGCVFWFLRRISPTEHCRHWEFEAERQRSVPPAWSDRLLLFELFGLFCLTLGWFDWPVKHPFLMPGWAFHLIIAVLIVYAIQVTQAGLFYGVWRWVTVLKDRLTPYSNPRNLFTSLIRFSQLTWIFAIIYWIGFRSDFDPNLISFLRSLYFSCVTATTVGYGDIKPCEHAEGLHYVLILQKSCSLLSLVVIISRAISQLSPVPDQTPKNQIPNAPVDAIDE
jgi:hypothetical protein